MKYADLSNINYDGVDETASGVTDYSLNADPKTILKDPRFLKDLRDYYAEKNGEYYESDEALVEQFYSDGTWRDLNTLGAVGGALDAYSSGKEDRERMKRIEGVWRTLPFFWQDGGRGASALPDIGKAIIADPLNLIPGAAAFKAGTTAARSAQLAGKSSPLLRGATAGAGKGALVEGGISGAQEAIVNTATQARDLSLGLRDEFSGTDLATATGVGAVLGGGVGGAIGAGAGVAGASRGMDQADNLRRLNLTDDQIARMSEEDIANFTQNTQGTAGLLPEPRVEENTQTTTTTEPVAPIDDIEAAKSTLQVALRVSRNKYDEAVKSGADADTIKELKKERDELAMLDGGILERLKREDEQIKKLEQDETRLAEAKKLRTRFEDDFSKLRILIDGDFIDDGAVEAFDADLAARGVGTDKSTPNTADNIKDEPLAETEVKTEETTATSPTNEAVPEASADASPSSTTPTNTTTTTTPEPTKVALDDDSVVNYNTDAQKASIEKIIADSNGAYTKENFMSDFRAGLFPVKGNGKLQSSTPGLLRERVKEVQSKKVFEDAKDTKSEAEVEAEIDNGVVASPEVRGRLLANGIDWRDIAPAEKSEGNRITKKTASRAIKNKTEDSAVAQQAQKDLDEIAQYLEPTLDLAEARNTLAILVSNRSNADDILDLWDYHVGALDDTKLKQELFTTTEKKQIRRLVKASKERGLPENTAQFIAEQKVLENRGIPAKSGERTTQKAIDNKTVYETAGRNNDGGIQSFLKKSNAYGVDGKYRVDKTSFTKDEAILKAQAKNKSDIVPYVTTGREAVKTARGDITVEAGTTVFADAKTGRSYATMKDALIMRGDMKPSTPKKETTLDDVAAQFRALVEANKDDPDRLLDVLKRLKEGNNTRGKSDSPAEVIAETENPSAPPTRGDKVLIVQSKSDPNDVRMMGRKQIDDGKDISAIIGKSGDKSNPDNWIVKYAPMSAIGTRSRALKKLFDSLPIEEAPTSGAGARLEVGGQTGTAEPLNVEDFNKLEFTLTEGEVKELRGLGREIRGQTNLFAKSDGKGNFKIDGQSLRHITNLTEHLRWGQTLRDHKVVADTLGMLYDVQARQNPQGFKLPNPQREEVIDRVEEMFTSFSKEEIIDAKNFLSRLGGDQSVGPKILSVDIKGQTAYYASGGKTNMISFDKRRADTLIPRTSTLYHEVAHWAYSNILTPEDRLYFWDAMKKYYNGQNPAENGNYVLNVGQVKEGLYAPPGMAITRKGSPDAVISNSMHSPQEFFANQFEMWVARNNKVAIKDETFWKRVTDYVKAIFDRYFSGAKIDPDLEPLFAKILPEAQEKKFGLGVDATPTTKEGKVIQGRYVMAEFNKTQMEEAINAKDSDGIITAFDEFRKYLLGVAKNDGEGATGALLALRMGRRGRGALKIIRQRINDIDEIMYGKRVQDTAFGEEKFNPSAYDDLTLTANPDDVANTLSDFYYNGYQGSFQPELGLPGKINETNIDKTNIPSLVKIIQTRLNARYQQIEETTNLIPGSKPETKAKTIPVRENGRVEPTGTKGKILNEKVKEDERIDAQAQAEAKTTRNRRVKKPSTGRHQTDGSVSAEVKSESLANLRTLYQKHKGSDYGDQVAMEITAKIKAQKLPSKQVPITRAVMESSGAELEQGYLNAIATNNTKDMNMFGYEMQRRIAKKNARKKGVEFTIKPVFIKQELFTRELNDNTGVMTNDGVPPASRSSIREALSFITHRNPEMNTAGRTMAYRLFNIMNRTAKGTLEDANQLTLADVSRLGKKNYVFEEDVPFSDFKSSGFNEFRNIIRRTSRTFHANDAEASGAVKEVMGMIGRATLNNEQKTALLDFYRQVKPSVAERFFSKQDVNLPDQLKEEYASIDLFTEVMTEIIDSRNTKNIDDFLEDMINDGVPPSLLNTWIKTGDEVTEYTAYVLNGNIGSKKAKENFQRLDVYGDMFAHGKKPMHGTLNGYHLTHPSYAADYAFDTLQSMPKARLSKLNKFVKGGFGHDEASDMPIMFYHGTPNGTKLKKVNNPDVIFQPSKDGLFGYGYYLTLNPHVASQVYSRQPTTSSILTRINSLTGLTNLEKQDLYFDVSEMQADRLELTKLRRKYAEFGDDEFASQEAIDARRAPLASDIRDLMTSIMGMELRLQEKGLVLDPMVMPMVIDLKKPLDLRTNTSYDLQFDEMPRAFLAKIVEKELLNPRSAEVLAEEMTLAPKVTGEQFYFMLADQLETANRSKYMARGELNKIAEELGYDGMITTHRNVLGEAGAENLAFPYTGTRESHTSVILFNPNQSKHIDAEFFDSDDARMYNQVLDSVPIPRGTMGAVTEGLMLNQINGVSDIPTGQFGELLEQNGTNATLTGAMMSMIKKRNLNATEEQAIRKRSPFTYFQSQSERMKSMGANYLSNFYKNHFPDMNQRFASKFMPIANALAKLEDADGMLRGYFRKTTASIGQKQPKSHQNIVRALRRGDGSRQEKALSADERNIYKQIRSMFAGERQELVDAGYHVGDRGPNYLPQVWDAKKILKDKDVFMDKMKRYYIRERMDNGFQVREDEATAFAEGLMITLTKEGDDGVFVPVRGTTRNPTFENVDYSRVIALEKYPDMLDELEQYLEADLNGLLVKYVEGSSRRITHAKKLGVNSHGVYDYLAVAADGEGGIARLLSTNKIFKKDLTAMTENGRVEVATIVDTIRMPFEGNEQGAGEFARQLINAYNTQGTAAARKMLEDLPVSGTAGKPSQTYARRVDAIVGALEDYKGKAQSIEPQDEKFIESAMQVAMKKPLTAFGGKGMVNTSRAIRMANNVTLLGFTTLTSLGDVVLPIIRSGSFSSWAKGLGKWATDPEYRVMLKNVGVAMENIVHERMVHMYGAPDNKASHAFFNATLLTPWTDMNRSIAGATGFETFKAMQIKARNQFKENLPYAQQTAKYKTAHRFLSNYGLNAFLPGGKRQGESLGNMDLMKDDTAMRMAIIKFADDSIFQPNPNDVPLWAQTPIGALVFQLKSFPLMMTRLTGHVLSEANKGNVKPLMYLGLLGPAFGAVTLSAKDVIQQRGGEDGQSAELRKRNIAKALGHDEKTHGNVDDFLGWYVEGMLVMGGLGLMGDVIHSTVSQVDNGAYGQQRIWSTLLGPSYGLGNAVTNVAAGAFDENESNAKERSATRELATRIPILGGNRKFRETVVDGIAGESSSKSNGWSSSWGSEWK